MKIMQNHFLLTCAPQQLHGPFSSTQSNSSNSFQCSHTHKIDHGNNEFKIIDVISIFAFTTLFFFYFSISRQSWAIPARRNNLCCEYFSLLMFYLEYNGKKSVHKNFHSRSREGERWKQWKDHNYGTQRLMYQIHSQQTRALALFGSSRVGIFYNFITSKRAAKS